MPTDLELAKLKMLKTKLISRVEDAAYQEEVLRFNTKVEAIEAERVGQELIIQNLEEQQLKNEAKLNEKADADSRRIIDENEVEETAARVRQKIIDTVVGQIENPTPFPLPSQVRTSYIVKLTVCKLPMPNAKEVKFLINVQPSVPTFGVGKTNELSIIKLNNIPLSLESSIIGEVDRLLSGKVENFFDNERKLKTLLNFGTDYQPLIVNWKLDEVDETGQGIILKLYKPLPPEVAIQTPVFISRELSYPTIEKIFIIDAPIPAPNVYLRYPNKRLKIAGRSGGVVNDATLDTLLSSGAFDEVKPQDRVMDEWFTTALEGVELNIDYSNFRNFVFYGSAEKRLEAFKNKLNLIENYDAALSHTSESLSSIVSSSISSPSGITLSDWVLYATGSTLFYIPASASLWYDSGSELYITKIYPNSVSGSLTQLTSSLAYPAYYIAAQERQSIIRSFDGYERFLYYGSGSEMSGSFTREIDRDEFDVFYYLPDATWPKIGDVVAPVASASIWYTSVSDVAKDYDKWNVNRFVNNLPEYIRNDDSSETYLRFFDLAGHMFDTVKLYIDQMPNIYDRNSDASEGLSSDLVWDIANAFGINLPNQYAIENILDYTLGVSKSSKIYKQSAAETWRRFLHNQIFLMKSKGTKTALRALLNVYGVLPTTIQIRESSTPGISDFYASQSYEIYEENTNALVFDDNFDSYIIIPWPSGTLAIQTRFATSASGQTQVLFNVDNLWAAMLVPGSGSEYQLQLRNGVTTTATSSYWPMGYYYNLMLVCSGSNVEMYLKRVDSDGDIVVDDYVAEIGTGGVGSVWDSSTNFYVGGWSGSIFGNGFTGTVDEVRLWNESITEETYTNWVKYPGMYNGNTSTSARDYLMARLSFNTAVDLGSPIVLNRFVLNESPHQRLSTALAKMSHFSASGFEHIADYPYNMVSYTRTVQRFTPMGGGTQFDTNKIIIEDAPVLQYMSGSISGSNFNIPVLHKDSSIIPRSEKEDRKTANNTVGFYFSSTEAINDSIIRSIGNIDICDYIADPLYLSSDKYKSLNTLNEFYWTNYAYSINTNLFIDFVKNLLSPLFEQARQLVPVRAKLLAGIVIEPHLLERNKIAWKPIIKEESDLDVTNNLSSQPVAEGAIIDNDVTYDLSNNTEIYGEEIDKDAIYDVNVLKEIISEIDDNNGIISLADKELDSEYVNYADTLNMYQEYLVDLDGVILDYTSLFDVHEMREDAYTLVGSLFVSSSIYSPLYGSLCDLEFDIGATNYFAGLGGLVGVKDFTYVRTKNNILVDKGTWVAGNQYNKNDVVLQPTTITDSSYSAGNGQEFYAIRDNYSNAVSGSKFVYTNTPPYGDVTYWRRVAYTPAQILNVKTAVIISGSLSLMLPANATARGYTPVTGYLPQHYKYFQPNYTAFRRSRYIGCVQSDITTSDAKPAVEVLLSSGDTLVVSATSEPIQNTDNLGGLTYLDVK